MQRFDQESSAQGSSEHAGELTFTSQAPSQPGFRAGRTERLSHWARDTAETSQDKPGPVAQLQHPPALLHSPGNTRGARSSPDLANRQHEESNLRAAEPGEHSQEPLGTVGNSSPVLPEESKHIGFVLLIESLCRASNHKTSSNGIRKYNIIYWFHFREL